MSKQRTKAVAAATDGGASAAGGNGKGSEIVGADGRRNTPALQRYTPAQVIAAIRRAHGIASAAAEVLRCNRRVIYRYMDKYPEIKAAYEEARDETVDYAESKQIKALKKGERWAIENWLFYSKEGRKRGWIRRAERAQDQGLLNAIQIIMPDNSRGDAALPEVTIQAVEADLTHMKQVSGLVDPRTGGELGDETDWLFEGEELEGATE